MPIEFVDRVPTRPGRVKITPENGGSAYYATVERADAPTQEGTPLSAANLNAAQDPYLWRTETRASSYKMVYLSPTGSDTNDGRLATPMLTIKAAIRKYAKSAKYLNIELTDGTYTEDIGELAADLCHVHICSYNSSKDKVTINVTGSINSYLPSLHLEQITISATAGGISPLCVYAGQVFAESVRLTVPTTTTAKCVEVYDNASAYLYECILNGGTSSTAYCETGYIKAVDCTSERQLAIGFSARWWGRIEYTPTLTATTMTETKTNGVCVLANAVAGSQRGVVSGSSGQYQTFDGLLIQWGQENLSNTVANSLTTKTITYPLNFAGTPLIFASLGESDRASSCSVGATTTTTGATISLFRPDNKTNTYVNWLAIGKGFT